MGRHRGHQKQPSPSSSSLSRRSSDRLKLTQPKITDIVHEQKNLSKLKKKPLKRNQKLSSTSSVEVIEEVIEVMEANFGLHIQTKEDLLKELIKFDLDSAFGPCVGITRFERIDRALMYKLSSHPSSLVELKEHLKKYVKDDAFIVRCIWDHLTLYADRTGNGN